MIGDRWSRTFSLGLIGVASFSSLLPIVLAVMNALKTTVEIGSNPLALPTQLHWENFSSAWRNAQLGPSLLHSAEVASLTILMVCVTATPCAYVLARQKGKFWRFITFYFMATITVPVQLYLYPLYFIFAKLGLVNSIPAVALIYTAMFSPFAIFLLRTYALAIPVALEEAAQVDGATAVADLLVCDPADDAAGTADGRHHRRAERLERVRHRRDVPAERQQRHRDRAVLQSHRTVFDRLGRDARRRRDHRAADRA